MCGELPDRNGDEPRLTLLSHTCGGVAVLAISGFVFLAFAACAFFEEDLILGNDEAAPSCSRDLRCNDGDHNRSMRGRRWSISGAASSKATNYVLM